MKDKLNINIRMPKIPSAEALKGLFAGKRPALSAEYAEVENIPAPPKNKMDFKIPKAFDLGIRMDETGRYFSGPVFDKALQALDKSALLIVGVSWLVALLLSGVSFLAVKEASDLKVKMDTARALEPVLPKVNRLILSKEQYEQLVVRLKKQYPTISFEITGKPSLQIRSNEPDLFATWLNAIGYTDSLVPSIRWTMTQFCVGPECPGDYLMLAELTAEAINIAQPEGAPP